MVPTPTDRFAGCRSTKLLVGVSLPGLKIVTLVCPFREVIDIMVKFARNFNIACLSKPGQPMKPYLVLYSSPGKAISYTSFAGESDIFRPWEDQ